MAEYLSIQTLFCDNLQQLPVPTIRVKSTNDRIYVWKFSQALSVYDTEEKYLGLYYYPLAIHSLPNIVDSGFLAANCNSIERISPQPQPAADVYVLEAGDLWHPDGVYLAALIDKSLKASANKESDLCAGDFAEGSELLQQTAELKKLLQATEVSSIASAGVGGGQPPVGLQQQQSVGGGQFTPGFEASDNNNRTELWGVPGGGATASAHQQQQVGGVQMRGGAAFGNGGGAGFMPWSDNMTQTLFGGKSLTSLYEPGGITGGICSGNMGWNSWAPGNPMATTGAGGGGGYEQQQMPAGDYGQNVVGGPSPSPIGTTWSPMQAQYGAMAYQVLDLRASMESPLGDKSRQMPGMQTLIEQLHHTFPKSTSEKLMEAVEEYKHTSAGKSFKTQTLEAVAQGVCNLILTKQRKQMADGTMGWQIGASKNLMGGPGGPGESQGATVSQASSSAAAINISKNPMVGTEACGYCVDLLYKQPASTLSYKHKTHVKCAKEWFGGGQQTCPACRVYVLPPEDYPELS